MAVTGYLDDPGKSDDPRKRARRPVRLTLSGKRSGGAAVAVTVHNISANGLLIECSGHLGLGDPIEVALPHAGTTSATVIWRSGDLHGCTFDTPISVATLSASRLRGAVHSEPEVQPTAAASRVESLGARIHRLRLAAGLTQAEVSEKLNVSEASISAWEQDKSRPKAGRVEMLAELLGVDPTELLGIGPSVALQDVVARAKMEIAACAHTSPDQVSITIAL